MASRGANFAPSARSGVHFTSSFPGLSHDRFHHHHRDFDFGRGAWLPWWRGYSYYAYPYSYYSYGYPLTSWDSYSYFSDTPSYDVQSEMSSRIESLSNEVERLREEQELRAYGPPPPPPPRPAVREQPSQPTALVFRDRRTEEVQNYAIAGQTLWIFNEERARKVPLSELDIPATTKLNEERGVDFHVPSDVP